MLSLSRCCKFLTAYSLACGMTLTVLAADSFTPIPYPSNWVPLRDLPLPSARIDRAGAVEQADYLRERMAEQGSLPLQVHLRVPGVVTELMSPAQQAQWRAELEQRTQALLQQLAPAVILNPNRLPDAPTLELTTDAQGLEALLAHTDVANLTVGQAPGMRRLAAGYGHSLAIKDDGTLWAWGYNGYQQLGDGTSTDRATPVQVLADVETVVAGDFHNLAIKSDRSLWGWGYNDYGQLSGGCGYPCVPTQILDEVATVAAGDDHTLVLKTDGSLWTMGRNHRGQLGDGTIVDRSTPQPILSGVIAIGVGYDSSFAVTTDGTDGTLWAWGANDYGVLGDGTTTDRYRPVQVLTGVVAVDANYYDALALKNDGSLWAWGKGYLLGINDTLVPQQILTNIVAIAAGGFENVS